MESASVEPGDSFAHPELGYFIPQGTDYLCIWLVKIYGYFQGRNHPQVTYQKKELLWSALGYKPTGHQADTTSIYQTNRDVIAFNFGELFILFNKRMDESIQARNDEIKLLRIDEQKIQTQIINLTEEVDELRRDIPPWGDIEFKTRPVEQVPPDSVIVKQGATNKIATKEELDQAWKQIDLELLKDGDYE